MSIFDLDFFAGIFDLPAIIFMVLAVSRISLPVFSIYRQSFYVSSRFQDFFAGIFDLPAIILYFQPFFGFLCRYFRFTGNHFMVQAVFRISLPVFSIYRQSSTSCTNL
ncbi:hypothetical protein ROU88_10655 [Macrococcus capreoli]